MQVSLFFCVQILTFQEHIVSYAQVRGSIPVYWSQPGHRYRPPPILDKGKNDSTLSACCTHSSFQVEAYHDIFLIFNLWVLASYLVFLCILLLACQSYLSISGEKETEAAFRKHFDQQLSLYKHVTCLSLVDRKGREKVMADAFLHHTVLFNNPSIAYVAFDFHEYW